MTDFHPTHVHNKTGEPFEMKQEHLETATVRDAHGFRRIVELAYLVPLTPIEAWEPCLWREGEPFGEPEYKYRLKYGRLERRVR